ncbi:glycoside hydrolase family 6 protein [Streptacidiphilus sp. ASG 303]|uniref:glycoside hydrolase family 6 protein n=1 Tax=Streptacidiphilus sp. ASG 303 TaxID=2896847 RepID=UPI001E28E9AF|nr:glycoside hydrolase family 6 protein [Streptacidiphilus sp. ASG 303]MCD0485829.1 glycoside hydrolase family 6 protein [Streptacidiphilus sp. ASG 303]
MWRAAAAAALALAVAAGCTRAGDARGELPPSASAAAPRGPQDRPQPAGQQFYVSADGSAALQAEALRREGRTDEARELDRIADRPAALWLGGPDAAAKAERLTRLAAAAGRTALLVAYDIPHRDCGQYSAGGAADAAAYRAWIADVAAGIGDRPAWVVLEPDAVAHTLDGCVRGALADERYGLLADAVRELGRRPRVRVYLDAGNAGWVKEPDRMADALRRSGVRDADGFAVNVANFYTTADSAAYGRRVSRGLGGARFVIDTSRNGNGPLGGTEWCNPPGRALGDAPTTRTGLEGVDAYLWIKNPGESDGQCRPGAPAPGRFWTEYALDLVRNARR